MRIKPRSTSDINLGTCLYPKTFVYGLRKLCSFRLAELIGLTPINIQQAGTFDPRCPTRSGHFSLSQTNRESFLSRSFGRKCLSALIVGCSGCIRAAREQGFPLYNLRQGRLTYYSTRDFILSGYRGLSSVLQNAECRFPDVFQTSSPSSVSFQALHVLKRSWRALKCPTMVLKDLTK